MDDESKVLIMDLGLNWGMNNLSNFDTATLNKR